VHQHIYIHECKISVGKKSRALAKYTCKNKQQNVNIELTDCVTIRIIAATNCDAQKLQDYRQNSTSEHKT